MTLTTQITALRERKRAHEERVLIAKLALGAMPAKLASLCDGYREFGAPWFVAPTDDRATLRQRAEWCKTMARAFEVPQETLAAVFADLRTAY